MKSILIPVDFSKESEKALQVAARVAHKINAKLLLCHMAGIEELVINQNQAQAVQQNIFQLKLAEKQFSEFTDKEYLEGLVVEPVLQKELNFESIGEFASDVDASLIVMGTHGTSGFKEVISGSNTEKVVRSSQVPVLVVKENDLNFNPEKIVLASNFDEEVIPAYKKVLEIAEMFESRVELIYVNLPGSNFKSTNEMDEILLNFFTKLNHPEPLSAIKKVNRIAHYSIEEGIMSYAQLSQVDVIAIPTHGRTGVSRLLKGSVSEDIANHSILPVLTLKL